MIKKLGILSLLLIPSFSFAVNNVNDIGQYEDLGGNLCTINSDLSFDCENSDNVIVGTDASWYKTSSSYFRTNSGLAYYIYSNSTIFDNGQGYINSFIVCGGQVNCNNPSSISYYDFLDFYYSNPLTAWEWYSNSSTPGRAGPVFIFGNTYIYFGPSVANGNNIGQWYGSPTPYSFGLVGWGLDANYQGVIDSPFSTNNIPIPDGPGIDDYTYIQVNTGDRILYFEQLYNLRKNICFIGTKDLTSVYEDKIPFNEGTGYTIFDMYSNLFNQNNMSVYEVGTFWQEWYLNYQVWFQKKYGVPSMVAYYNGPGDFGINKGPDLSNPFLGNLSAYYFIASNLALGNYPSDIDGQKVAYYCYLKLGLSSFSNDGGNITINDDHDESYDQNIAVYTRNQINIRNQTTGGTVINSANWDGSPLDYYTGGSEYTDFNSFFSDNFTRFKGLFNLRNGDYGLGFIPSYIVIFLMGIILFRFLRH